MFHFVAIISAACPVRINLVRFMYLTVKKLRNTNISSHSQTIGLGNTFSHAQSSDHKSIREIIVRIGLMDICRFRRIIFPAHRTSTIEKDVVSFVKLAISLAVDINGNLHQIVMPLIAIHFRQHAAAIVIHTNLTWIHMGNIHTQIRQIRISQFVNARFGQAYFVPISGSHGRTFSIYRI